MKDVPAEWNRCTEQIIAAAMEVHSALGPGLLERMYEEAFCHELSLRSIHFERQSPIELAYKGKMLGAQTVDLLVADLVIVELKSIERVHDVHLRQLVSYMKSRRVPLGLLINFNVSLLKEGIFRRVSTSSTPIPTPFLTQD